MRNTGVMKHKSGIVYKGVRDNTAENQKKNVSHAIYFSHIFLMEKCHCRGDSHLIEILLLSLSCSSHHQEDKQKYSVLTTTL